MKSYLVLLSLIMGVSIYSQITEKFADKSYDDIYQSRISLSDYADSLVLDSIITNYMDSYNVHGMTSIIWKKDKIIWKEHYGYRNVEQQLPYNDSTLWLSGSISKTILATAIM